VEANVSVGNVSALAGIADDSRYFQISAPVQPGNSGGPLLDGSGRLVGIVTAKLNALRMARFTGDIPENVNFAIKAEVARTFLDSKHISYQTARSDQQLSPADIGDLGRPFTVHIECERPAAATATASPPPPKKIEATQQEIWWCRNEINPDLAIKGCTTVIDFDRSVWAFSNRGQAYYRKGNLDSAIADFTDAIKLEPKLASAYNSRGIARRRKADNDLAIADFNEAINLNQPTSIALAPISARPTSNARAPTTLRS
jgi:tetratricopeptide (TPR) repeat protein